MLVSFKYVGYLVLKFTNSATEKPRYKFHAKLIDVV